MLIKQKCKLKLSAYAVSTADKNRFFHILKIRRKQSAKSSDTGNNTVNFSAGNVFFHQLD